MTMPKAALFADIGRCAVWLVVAAATAPLGCAAGDNGGKPTPKPTVARGGDPPAATRPAPASPTTRAAPAATGPAKDWKPPRFTARQIERDAMVRQIERYGLTDKAALAAMRAVPRHEFVPARDSDQAYADTPLPIGKGQTISQPYIVAEMTRQLHLTKDSRVLEIGTGSGYQAAVLTEFTPHVYTIEIVKPLADAAAHLLRRLGYTTVQVRHGDGYKGWKEHAPFDAIIVTCGASQVPPPLVVQLKPGGRIVIPVGETDFVQQLMVIEKAADGTVRQQRLMPVRFVPLTREVR